MKIINVQQNTDEWLEGRKGKILGSNVYNVLSANTATKDEIISILDEFGVEYPKTTPRKEGDLAKPKGNKEDFEKLLTLDMEAELMRRASKKTEFYQLIADRIAIAGDYEYDDTGEIIQNGRSMMDRGHQLEDEAANIFAERTGKKLIQVGICVREDNENIGNSPDRLIVDEDGIATEMTFICKEALEIKCIRSAKHIQALIEQKIPEEYISQATQYFVVNDELQVLYFAFYDPRIPYACGFHWIEIKREDVQKTVSKYIKYETVLLHEAERIVDQLTF